MERRTIFKWVSAGIGLTVAGVVGIPSLISGLSPMWTSGGKRQIWQSIGIVAAYPLGVMRRVIVTLPVETWNETLRNRLVYAWRPSLKEVLAFSPSCTDLGCPLTFDTGSEWFFCPCHGGIFDKYGRRRAGPPNRSMYRYDYRIIDNEILIDLYSTPPMT
jgi:menaquinol-cytochrome c reductase iron-sulfur subunit